jgi:hypothetical protein
MMELYEAGLAALEHSSLGHLARHSVWTYTVSNVLHVLGAALLVGAIAVFDMTLVLNRLKEAAVIGRIAIPLAATGLMLQVPTGLVLLAPEATALGINPAFFAKVVFIAVGLINVAVFHLRFGADLRAGTLVPKARGLAYISLVAWLLTLTAGRMIAYL